MDPVHENGGDEHLPVPLEESKTLLLQRHISERNELTKSYERKKSFIPRKDRSGRARLAEELASEERALHTRQAQELKAAGIKQPSQETAVTAEVSTLASAMDKLPMPANNTPFYSDNPSDQSTRKESKAARRRRLRAEQDLASERRVAESRAAQGVSEREAEMAAIEKQLDGRRLRVHPIAADGHCLYNAVAHQMQLLGADEFDVDPTPRALRNAAADHMLARPDDFILFVDSVAGDRTRFADYCHQLRTTAAWGGQVELRALAEVLDVTIEVYVAYMDVLRMGTHAEEGGVPVLRVSYHQKYYGLGEHYNSVVPRAHKA